MAKKTRIERLLEITTTLITPELNKQNTATRVNTALEGIQEDSLNFEDDNLAINEGFESLEYKTEPIELSSTGLVYKKYIEDNYLNQINNVIEYKDVAFVNRLIASGTPLLNRDDRKFANISQVVSNEFYNDETTLIVADDLLIDGTHRFFDRNAHIIGRFPNSKIQISSVIGYNIGANVANVKKQIIEANEISLNGTFLIDATNVNIDNDYFFSIICKKLIRSGGVLSSINRAFDIQLGDVNVTQFNLFNNLAVSETLKRQFKNTILNISGVSGNSVIAQVPASVRDGLILENLQINFNQNTIHTNGIIKIGQDYTTDSLCFATIKDVEINYTGVEVDAVCFDFINATPKDLTIKVEGVVKINVPVFAKAGSIYVFEGSGTVYYNGNIIYDGGRTSGGGSIEQTRTQNENASPSSKLFDNLVLFKTSLPNGLEMPVQVGGIPAGTTVEDLVTRGGNGIIEDLLFPTVEASIGTPVSASILHGQPSTLEVGTVLNIPVTCAFNRGQVLNGNQTVAGEVVGNPTNYTMSGGFMGGAQSIPDSALEVTFDNISGSIAFGNNILNIVVEYNAGVGDYFNNKGVLGTNLDASRVAGSISVNAVNILGRRRLFFGTGSPVNSAQVRALANSVFLNGSNNGSATSFIAADALTNSFSVPAGKTVVIIDLDNLNANVTSDYAVSTFNVNDNGGNPVSYDTYTLTLGVAYGSITRHQITVS